jgi:hypothetical protein
MPRQLEAFNRWRVDNAIWQIPMTAITGITRVNNPNLKKRNGRQAFSEAKAITASDNDAGGPKIVKPKTPWIAVHCLRSTHLNGK